MRFKHLPHAGVSGLALAVLIAAPSAWAQVQIQPNPNPGGNTVTPGNGDFNAQNPYTNNGTLSIVQSFSNQSGADIENNGTISTTTGVVNNQPTVGTFSNVGTVNNNAGGQMTVDGNATIANNFGAIINNAGTVTNSSNIANDGSITNQGNFTINSGAQLSTVGGTGSYSQTAGTTRVDGTLIQKTLSLQGGTLTGQGVVTVTNGLTNQATINGDPFLGLLVQAAVSGTGNYTGKVIFNGSLSTGAAPAKITGETLVFGAGNALSLKLGGTSRGVSYDAIDATGDVTLGGLLDVTLADLGGGTFDPALNDKFDLIDAASFTGTDFDSFDLPTLDAGLEWDHGIVSVDGEQIYELSVGAAEVPEPATSLLLLAGMGGLGALRVRPGMTRI
jgi:hypothetical protein